jgi:hypothetical protein
MAQKSRSNARFTISGSASTGLVRGYDATADQVLDLQLETQPPLDTRTCVYSIKGKSPNAAPDPVLSGGGVASPVSAIVTLTCPSAGAGAVAYRVRCQVNEGEPVLGPDGGEDFTRNTFERVVVIRTTTLGLRLILVGETNEYDTIGGWVEAVNQIAIAMETIQGTLGSISGGLVFPATPAGTFSITQTAPAAGVTPTDGLIAAEDAHTGDAKDGASLTVRGGRPGSTAANRTGNLVLDLGNPDVAGNETGRVIFSTVTTPRVTLWWDGSLSTFEELVSGGRQIKTTTSLALLSDTGAGTPSFISLLGGATGSVSILGVRLFLTGQILRNTVTQSASGNFAIDFDVKGADLDLTLTGNATIMALSHVFQGGDYRIQVRQSGGPWTLNWGASVKFGADGGALTNAADAIDIFNFRGDSGGVLRLSGTPSRGVDA